VVPLLVAALRLGHCIAQSNGDVQKIQRCQKKFVP